MLGLRLRRFERASQESNLWVFEVLGHLRVRHLLIEDNTVDLKVTYKWSGCGGGVEL